MKRPRDYHKLLLQLRRVQVQGIDANVKSIITLDAKLEAEFQHLPADEQASAREQMNEQDKVLIEAIAKKAGLEAL